MEFLVIRSALLNELQLMTGMIEKKNTMPILANIYIKAENNQLTLKATDLEVGLISQCSSQVVEGGEFTVNGKRLIEMLTAFSDDQVSFSMSEGSMLDLVCGSARFSVETMPTQDFPTIPEYSFEHAINMKIGFFNDCISNVFFSISNDAHKYALNGALLQIENNEMIFVSTDGHRMSVVNKSLAVEVPNFQAIIPRKSLTDIKKSLNVEDDKDDFQFGIEENRIFFKIGVRILFSRLIDGNFPDFNKAIPQNNDKVFTFDRGLLLQIVKRKSIISSDKSRLVRFSFENNKVTVVLRNAEHGESVDQIDVEYDGSPIHVGFNVEYLHEFLKNMSCEKIEVYLKDEANQGLFKLCDDDLVFDYRHVIMPMRLS